ncbi:MAG: hypothetical protein M1352_03495 [Patescibacteria group bacterium]|nr:hypothetical protein [Patescibacteria group bacterium]
MLQVLSATVLVVLACMFLKWVYKIFWQALCPHKNASVRGYTFWMAPGGGMGPYIQIKRCPDCDLWAREEDWERVAG